MTIDAGRISYNYSNNSTPWITNNFTERILVVNY